MVCSKASCSASTNFFLIGLGKSSAVGPELVGELATTFLDALYKA